MIELLCTLTGIIAGVAVVASLFHYSGDRNKFEAKAEDIETDKIRGIADQLQVISHRVAANVSAHSEKVEHFSGKLSESDQDKPEQILSTIQEIILANESMQGQLADAQKRIAQQSEMIEQAAHQARTDALTGLANRRALDEFLSNCIASGNANDEIVGLLMMDIDHFKSFNDSFGHTTGDAVLASFARSISKICGQECYAARFGGEEFGVILTAPTAEQLALRSAEIRQYVSEQVISYEDLQLKITSSAGLCRLLPGDTVAAAYERADEGLYQSKKSGRNCGYWLSDDGWAPFPKVVKMEPGSEAEAKLTELRSTESKKTEPAAKAAPSKNKDDEATKTSADATVKSPEKESTKPEGSEILDLNSFLGRLDAYMQQLRRAELPASAFMVEAVGLAPGGKDTTAAWEAVIGLVQANLRGIDVVCLFRPFTLCIFMPGCAQDAALERASKVLQVTNEALETWQFEAVPSKLATALASAESNEDVSHFLDRLERALEEAHDASNTEIVVQSGESSHFQPI